jgi:hypothetical protein
VPTFVDRWVLRGQRGGSPRSLISVFSTGAANFLSSSFSFILTRAEWTPFQTHCYSENLAVIMIITVNLMRAILAVDGVVVRRAGGTVR